MSLYSQHDLESAKENMKRTKENMDRAKACVEHAEKKLESTLPYEAEKLGLKVKAYRQHKQASANVDAHSQKNACAQALLAHVVKQLIEDKKVAAIAESKCAYAKAEAHAEGTENAYARWDKAVAFATCISDTVNIRTEVCKRVLKNVKMKESILENSKKELANAEAQLEVASVSWNAAREQLAKAKKELANAKKELDNARNELFFDSVFVQFVSHG